MGGKSNQTVSVDKYDLLASQRYVRELGLNNPLPLTLLISGRASSAFSTGSSARRRAARIRATGANPSMARAQGINTNANIVLGLALSNGLVAFSGGLLAQYQGSADVNMGRGAIVIGLAAVIIGEVLFGKLFRNFALRMLSVVHRRHHLLHRACRWCCSWASTPTTSSSSPP